MATALKLCCVNYQLAYGKQYFRCVPFNRVPTQCSLLPTPWTRYISWSGLHVPLFPMPFAVPFKLNTFVPCEVHFAVHVRSNGTHLLWLKIHFLGHDVTFNTTKQTINLISGFIVYRHCWVETLHLHFSSFLFLFINLLVSPLVFLWVLQKTQPMESRLFKKQTKKKLVTKPSIIEIIEKNLTVNFGSKRYSKPVNWLMINVWIGLIQFSVT